MAVPAIVLSLGVGPRMNRQLAAALAGTLCLGAWSGWLRAEVINVPNASFESPASTYVSIYIDSWQKSPKPAWYPETGGFDWTQLTGSFKNTPPGSSDRIDNCDGNQAIWLFAVPEVGLFQDYDSVDWDDPAPTHAFDATYAVGKSYELTVGVIGGGGNMSPGVTLEIGLYYRDAASNRITVAATSITNTTAVFGSTTHLVDFQVRVPPVKASDAWAGRHIGVRFLSTVGFDLQGGYWDLDNVRLNAIREPSLSGFVQTNGQFQFVLQSEPGLNFEILAATAVDLAETNWTRLGVLTNVTGSVAFSEPLTNFHQRFYRARQYP